MGSRKVNTTTATVRPRLPGGAILTTHVYERKTLEPCVRSLSLRLKHITSPDTLPSTTKAAGQRPTGRKLNRRQWLPSKLRPVGSDYPRPRPAPRGLLKVATSLLASRSPHDLKRVHLQCTQENSILPTATSNPMALGI